jgi:outer membrane protein
MNLKTISIGLIISLAAFSVNAEIKIGLLDVRTALFASDSAKEFTEKTVDQFKQQDLEVRAVGEDGQKLETRLKNDAAIMSDSERQKLASDLEAKIQEYKYLKSKLDSALAEKRQEFLSISKPRLDQAINELVAEEKLNLLLPREAALYADEAMDYTEKVVKKLNGLK